MKVEVSTDGEIFNWSSGNLNDCKSSALVFQLSDYRGGDEMIYGGIILILVVGVFWMIFRDSGGGYEIGSIKAKDKDK